MAQVSLFAKTRMVIGLAQVAQVEQLLFKKNNKSQGSSVRHRRTIMSILKGNADFVKNRPRRAQIWSSE